MSNRLTELLTNSGKFSYSLEVTPDIIEYELENLDLEPTFFSITWHAHVHKCKDLDIAPLKLAKYLRGKNKNVLLHISCCNMKKQYLDDLLVLLQVIGVCNIFIILGENFEPQKSDFQCSQDMIIYIRQSTGNYFCIGVAGLPDRQENIPQLKAKINSGVDFILTQAFFDCDVLERFVSNCHEADIHVPIIPGIFPFETKKELEGFVKLCKVHNITEDIVMKLSTQSGIEIVAKLINELIQQLGIKHLHFFTLNKMQRTKTLIENIK